MPVDFGREFLIEAHKEEHEEKLFLRWVVGYQSTTTFEEFKNKLMINAGITNDHRSAEEILDNVADMMKRFERV